MLLELNGKNSLVHYMPGCPSGQQVLREAESAPTFSHVLCVVDAEQWMCHSLPVTLDHCLQ